MFHRITVPVFLCCGFFAFSAGAHGPPDLSGISPTGKLFLNPGIILGGAWAVEGKSRNTFLLGGELSMVYWPDSKDGYYFGGYFDGVHDFDRQSGRLSSGATAGWFLGGLDIGYLVDLHPDGPHHGLSTRIFGSIGLVTLYVRYGYFPEAQDFVEIGLMIKLPFSLLKKKKDRWNSHIYPLGID